MLESKTVEYMEETTPIDRIIESTKNVGLSGLGGADAMRQKLEEYEAIRDVIVKYIESNFREDVDYGWTDKRAMDKKTLKKPGAEKLCHMFDTHPVWIRDTDSWECCGKPSGTIFLICQIIDNKTGQVIGEGRGAERIGNKDRDANKTIKNAEKCAIVDASIYTFMLSEFFTQDDGGRNRAFTLSEWKRALIHDVGDIRMGVESELSDLLWISKICKDVLHKKSIDTLGEHAALRKMIIEDRIFDLSTGERK